ncbi:MAG: hypothetical protein M3275_15210, partial [Thermoproteota archaeon]|nr:hypothetical protein [Thermoproteota archaeon]
MAQKWERRKVEELSARRRELHYYINRKRLQNNYSLVVDARGGFFFGCVRCCPSLCGVALTFLVL